MFTKATSGIRNGVPNTAYNMKCLPPIALKQGFQINKRVKSTLKLHKTAILSEINEFLMALAA